MAGYIGSKASVVSSGAERKKTFTITGSTTSLTGLNYTVGKVHVFQNGVRLVDGTDYTATNGTTITLTVAAQSGDNVVVISQASYQVADAVLTSGGTITGNLDVTGTVTGSTGITTGVNYGNFTPVTSGTTGARISANGNGMLRFASGGVDKMYVLDSGNVGIGESDPDSTLTVKGASHTNFQVKSNSESTKAFIQTVQDSDVRIGSSTNHPVTLYQNGSERMRIDASGNVGIGTASPTVFSGYTNVVANNSSGSMFELMVGGTRTGNIQTSSSLMNIQTRTNIPIAFDTNSSERMRIDSSGLVNIGITTGGAQLNVDATGDRATISARVNANGDSCFQPLNASGTAVGNIIANASSTAYNTSSDYRLKENVVDLTGASARVNQLNPSRFNFISDDTDTTVDGFLAHEVATVVPEAITGTKDAMKDEEYEVTPATGDIYTPATEAYVDDDGNDVDAIDEVIHSADAEQPETLEDGQQWRETTAAVMGTRSVPDYQGIDQSKLVPLLTAALQEALTEIASLKTRVEALEA